MKRVFLGMPVFEGMLVVFILIVPLFMIAWWLVRRLWL